MNQVQKRPICLFARSNGIRGILLQFAFRFLARTASDAWTKYDTVKLGEEIEVHYYTVDHMLLPSTNQGFVVLQSRLHPSIQ